MIGDECQTRTHDHRNAAALRHPLRIAADSTGGLFAHQAETDAHRLRPLGGNLGRLHHRGRTEAVTAIENEGCGAVLQQPRLRFDVDVAALDHFEIRRQARNAVAVDPA